MTKKSEYSIQEFITGGGDAGTSTGYSLVDPNGNAVADLVPQYDDYGIIGYGALIAGSGDSGSDSITPIDLDAINARAAQGDKPFGTGMGPALGYEYGMKNSEGDLFRKFDAQGNLTEYTDQHGQWQPASDLKPTGLIFNPSTGNLENTYGGENFPRSNLTESNASSINRYKGTSGGWLGEGGWGNIAMLAAAALTANPAWLVSMGIPAAAGTAVIQGAASIAKGMNNGQSFGEALTNAVKTGAINAATAGIMDQIGEAGLSNLAESGAGFEFAGEVGSFTDIAPVLESGGMFVDAKSGGDYYDYGGDAFTGDAGIPGSDMSFEDLIKATGISDAETALIPSDADFSKYIERYPDLTAAGIDTPEEAIRHYLDYGKGEGRDVSSSVTPVTPAPVTPPENKLPNPPPPPGPPAGAYWLNQSTGAAPDTVFKKSEPGPMYTPSKRSTPPPAVFVPPPGPVEPPVNEYIASGRYARDSQPKIYGAPGQDTSSFTPTFTEPVKEDLPDAGLGTDAGVGTGTDDTEVIPVLPDTGEEEQDDEEKKRRKQGEDALGMLMQMGQGAVKTPPVAKIDYMYDIGDESIFATPKQESLMPSPFEEAPEPVEGAMPNYQYYDTKGGYQYADGGMVAFEDGGMVDDYTIDDLYRMLGSK